MKRTPGRVSFRGLITLVINFAIDIVKQLPTGVNTVNDQKL